MHSVRNGKHGFTILEFLVVIAIITVFLGLLGAVIVGGGGAVAVQAGQRTLTTMISGARSQAMLNQTDARLIIHCDPPTVGDLSDPKREKYLRYMAIVVKRGDRWEPLNDGVYLPDGVYVVPPRQLNQAAALPPSDVISNSNTDWRWERRSIVPLDTMQYTPPTASQPNPPANVGDHYIFIEFDARGTTDPHTVIGSNSVPQRIVVAPAKIVGGVPSFEAQGDANARGGMIRRNGSFTLVDDPAGFPELP